MENEIFDNFLNELINELNISWWELLDSFGATYYEVFQPRLIEKFGKQILTNPDFLNWYNEMSMNI